MIKLKSLFPIKQTSELGIKIHKTTKIIKYDARGRITLDYLKKILCYDPLTGNWFWIFCESSHVEDGSKAGCLIGDGYISIFIQNKAYKAHVLAWFYMTGEWPKIDVDHKDLIRTNNKWLNLRLATRSQNVANRLKQSNNTSGFKGVSWHSQYKKWFAQLVKNGELVFAKPFQDKIKAAKAYDKAALKYFGEFANLNFPELKNQYLNELKKQIDVNLKLWNKPSWVV